MQETSVVRIMLRWSWLLVLTLVVGAVGGYLASSMMPNEYESEVSLLVGSLTETDPAERLGYGQLAQTYADLVPTPLVLDDVIARTGIEDDTDGLRDRVRADNPGGQGIIRVSAVSSSPEEAAAIAEAIGSVIERLSQGDAFQPGLAVVIEEAEVPTAPAGPRPTLNAAIGAGVGLLVALLVVFIVESSRTRPTPAPQPQAPVPPQRFPGRSGPVRPPT